MDPLPKDSHWLHRFAVLTALATLALIGLGGLVTSHGVGMAVPDWPTTYGENMFLFGISKWHGGIFYEHSHRLAASAVGFLTTILAVWMFGARARRWLKWGGLSLLVAGVVYGFFGHDEHHTGASLVAVGALALVAGCFWPRAEAADRRLRWLGVLAWFGVVLQGVLGGLRVVLLKDEIGIFHAAVAQAFLVLVCLIALFTSRFWRGLGAHFVPQVDPAGLRRWFAVVAVLIFAQLVLGASMRHQHAGLSIPDFPMAYGKLWPAMDTASVASYNQHRLEVNETNPITAFQIALQMAHRILALAILLSVAWVAWLTCRRLGAGHVLSRLGLSLLGLIMLQVVLGATTIWTGRAVDIATLHVLTGAVSLVTSALLTVVSFRVLIRGHFAVDMEHQTLPASFAAGKTAASGAR